MRTTLVSSPLAKMTRTRIDRGIKQTETHALRLALLCSQRQPCRDAFPPLGWSSRPVACKFGFLVPLVITGRYKEKNISCVVHSHSTPSQTAAHRCFRPSSRRLRLKTITCFPSRAATAHPAKRGEKEPLETGWCRPCLCVW